MVEEQLSRRRALVMLLLTPPLLFGLSTSSGQLAVGARKAGQVRLAMLSFWHVHASDNLHQALANHVTSVAAVWDEVPERGQAQAHTLGVPFYTHFADLLAHADVDGVIVDAPTTMHRDVMVAAAQAGKHIFTEKVSVAHLDRHPARSAYRFPTMAHQYSTRCNPWRKPPDRPRSQRTDGGCKYRRKDTSGRTVE